MSHPVDRGIILIALCVCRWQEDQYQVSEVRGTVAQKEKGRQTSVWLDCSTLSITIVLE